MEFRKLENETEEQTLWRLGQAKDNGLIDKSWDDIGDLMNRSFRGDESEYRTSSAYRKYYQYAKKYYESGIFQSEMDGKYLEELRYAKHELRKEKQKLFDERTALNKTLREQARLESLQEIFSRALDEHDRFKFEYVPRPVQHGDNDLIIHLTDLHCGINVDTPFNIFNSDVLKKRLHNFLDAIMEIQETYHSENAYLILGGDMIQGLIHLSARIDAKENTAQQIMIASDLIGNFIFELSKAFANVEVHTTAGNHARATSNKDDCAHSENFDLLIPFTCKKALQNVLNVKFVDNYLDYDIAHFTVRGHSVYATHGDKDNAKNVVWHMTQFARKAGLPLPDIIYLGHRHTNGLTTVDDVKVIESGCVVGMDNYAVEQRLVGTPEQTVTVVTEDCRIKALCDIQIN